MDSRIEKVKEIINNTPEKKVSTKTLADSVFLSESRLTHLFTEHVGIPIRRYRLWLRLLEALEEIFNGSSFTTAAHAGIRRLGAPEQDGQANVRLETL